MKVKSGFTLVDVLIVVVILGILAAIILPYFIKPTTEVNLRTIHSSEVTK